MKALSAPLILILALASLSSALASANTLLARNGQFEIWTQSIPVGAENASKIRGRDLLQFLADRLIPALPTQIAKAFEGQKVSLTFNPELKTDGLFLVKDPSDARTLRIDVASDLLASQDLSSVVAHEFFHAVHYVIHPDEEPWVREGLAQMFEFVVLREFNGTHLASAFAKPTTPLQGKYDPTRVVPEQYGHNLLYFYYLWTQCGGTPLFWSIAQGEPGRFGDEGITLALEKARSPKEQCRDFASSARDFEIARIHNQARWNTEDPERYYLWGTTLPVAEPLAKIDAVTLKNLPKHAPLVLRHDAKVPTASLQSLERFWLHKEFPYEVQKDTPSRPDPSWHQLILRL